MPRMQKRKRKPRKIIFRKKVCPFCTDKTKEMDYKDLGMLSRFTTERGKMIPRRVTGVCAKHQRKLAQTIKHSRFIALIPFIRK